MKKVIIAGLVVSAAVLVIASFFLPRRFVLEKAVDVAAPASYLFEEVNNLERWPLWSYWFDETAEITYGDSREGISARCAWKGRGGSGEVTVVYQVWDELVRTRIEFGTRGSATYNFTFIPDSLAAHQTRLILNAEVTAPEDEGIWSRWKRFLLANRLASSLTHNLATLKRIAETKPVFDNITEELLAPEYYVSVREEHHPDSAVIQIRALHAQVTHALEAVGSEVAGHPFCFFDDSAVMEFAVPVEPDTRVPNEYAVSQHYSGLAIRGTDYDGYDDIARTHHEVLRYIQYKDYVLNGRPWEVYMTDPDDDPSTWTTEVYYPIRIKEDEDGRL
ncbi:MAG: hypothetical protein LOY03_03450 [Cyclobacteriaceae bacterium]|jgi:effector-binding domain-containing protein|nr:hypothetical protein [Cyclobacteriaceae bacterium]